MELSKENIRKLFFIGTGVVATLLVLDFLGFFYHRHEVRENKKEMMDLSIFLAKEEAEAGEASFILALSRAIKYGKMSCDEVKQIFKIGYKKIAEKDIDSALDHIKIGDIDNAYFSFYDAQYWTEEAKNLGADVNDMKDRFGKVKKWLEENKNSSF